MRRICFVLLFVSFFSVQPVFGQFREAGSRLTDGAVLIYFGEDGKEVLGELQTLVRTTEFAEINLQLLLLEPKSRNARKLQRELGLENTAAWALADSKGHRLLQGDEFPRREDISQALERAGIRSPMAVLRYFIRRNPDHLGAKMLLLPQIRKLAETRTVDLLKFNVKTSDDIRRERLQREARSSGFSASIFSPKYVIDTSNYGDVRLDEKNDLEIWGQYAQELETLFRTGDWRLFELYNQNSQIPAEACSPLMRSLYGRLLPQVLLALRERPTNFSLWATYGWMRGVLKDRGSIQLVLDTLAPTPTKKPTWPPKAVYDFFAEEAKEQNNWTHLADLLWEQRHAILFGLYPNLESELEEMKHLTDFCRAEFIEPLLESLIRTSRIDDAEYIITNTAKLKFFPDFTRQAAAMAAKCGRPDLERTWLRLHIPEKTSIEDRNDLEALIYGVMNSRLIYPPLSEPIPGLFLINANISHEKQLKEMISFTKLPLTLKILNENESDLMLIRQHWSGDETRWVLLNIDGKMISSGMGLPSENDLLAVAEQIKSESLKELRQFIREHPNQFEAKNELLLHLREIALDKTRTKIKESQNSDKLSSEDDFMIWSEYASLFRQLVASDNLALTLETTYSFYGINHLPSGNITKTGNSTFSDYTTVNINQEVDLFNYSSIMTSLSQELLPIVSSNILRQPSNMNYWNLWIFLSDPNSATQARDLIDAITVSPFENMYSVPPEQSVQYLVTKYKTKKNWQGIANVLEVYWESLISANKLTDLTVNISDLHVYVTPLLEAYLNLNQEGKLNSFVYTFKQTRNWNRHSSRIRELFKQHGKVFMN